jgi:hypothetical protein
MRRASLAAVALAGSAGGLALSAGPGALAQPFGLDNSLVSATLSQRVEADSNYVLDDTSPGTSYFTDSRIELEILNATPTQAFTLGLDTGARALWQAEEAFELTFASPTLARAGYETEWASGTFDTEFRYRQARTGFDRLLQDFIVGDGVVILPDDFADLTGETTERRYDAVLNLAFGTDTRSSYAIGLLATRYDYDDLSLNRIPRTTLQGEATWTLAFTPTLGGQLLGNLYSFEAENLVETRVRIAEIEAGVVLQPSEILRLTGAVGLANRTEEQLVGGERVTVEDDTGPALRTGLRYEGQAFLVDGNARLSTAAPDPRLDGLLRVTYPLPRSRVAGRAYRRYIGGNSGETVRLSGLGLTLTREINSISFVDLDFAYSNRVNEDDPTEPDSRRIVTTATYSRALTENVIAGLGYRYRSREEDPDSAQSHAVFFELGRQFESGF